MSALHIPPPPHVSIFQPPPPSKLLTYLMDLLLPVKVFPPLLLRDINKMTLKEDKIEEKGLFKWILIEKYLCCVFLILMPRPSARTKNFLSRTIFKLSRTKILSRVKKSSVCFQKSFKTKFPDWKSIFKNKYSFCMTFESKKCSF